MVHPVATTVRQPISFASEQSQEHVQTGKKFVKGKVGLIRVDDVDSLVPAGIADEMVEETFIVGSDIEASNEKDVRPIRL